MRLFIDRVSILKQSKLVLIATFLVVIAAFTVPAQSTFVKISLVAAQPGRVSVEIGALGAAEWSFRNSSGSIVGLAERIQNFHGAQHGREVPVKVLAPGQFRFSEPVTNVRYDVLLTPRANLVESSHVSWLNEQYGLLMLRDLLPEAGMGPNPPLNLELILPASWTSASSLNPNSGNRYEVLRPERTVFLVGRTLRVNQFRVEGIEVKIVTSGDWSFKDQDLNKIVSKIIQQYREVTQQRALGPVALLLIPFGQPLGPERWSAETIERSVVLMMGRQATRNALLARLRVVLNHELFHLWIPNSLSLKGEYDWFFEGFTLYQALLTGLRLHHIKFEDYLETLGRVYDSYRSSTERDRLSLLEASERRWTTLTPLVYDKGMLVAFIYDLMVRQNSGNRATLSDLYPQLSRVAVGNPREANDLLMEIMDRGQGMQGFSERFVKSPRDIDLATTLKPFGLEIVTNGARSQIKVSPMITREQRKLFKALGHK